MQLKRKAQADAKGVGDRGGEVRGWRGCAAQARGSSSSQRRVTGERGERLECGQLKREAQAAAQGEE